MSGKIKVAVSVIVVAAVLAGLYWWYTSSKDSAPASETAQTQTPQDANTGPTLPSGADTSDAALEQDVASVDADMNAMAGDTAAIDSGINDTPVPQN